MADFNFGFVGSALEAGRTAAAAIDYGPTALPSMQLAGDGFADFIRNADRVFTVSGSSADFIWGHDKWGSTTKRVAK